MGRDIDAGIAVGIDESDSSRNALRRVIEEMESAAKIGSLATAQPFSRKALEGLTIDEPRYPSGMLSLNNATPANLSSTPTREAAESPAPVVVNVFLSNATFTDNAMVDRLAAELERRFQQSYQRQERLRSAVIKVT